MDKNYKQCTRCIMDTTDPDITFDNNGVCNHCERYDTLLSIRVFRENEGKIALNSLVENIKRDGKGKEYDCVIGVSGGVDSTYVAYLAHKLGLRPLAIHFDNGWNSELAVSNIEKTLNKLGIDLYTYVIDWEEFRDLQLSFLLASTPDGEIPTDHAINALLFEQASKRNIKYIINGMNFKTESLSVPKWSYGHSDWKYIKNIHSQFGKVKLKNYPHFSLFDTFYFLFFKRIKLISILNYIDYNKDEVMGVLENELDWKYYGGKHYESVYTRFYQAYILPKKFNIDKRLGHLSDLIRSGNITRSIALLEFNKSIADDSLLMSDKAFVMKKLCLDESAFEKIMTSQKKYFTDYPNNYNMILLLKDILNRFRSKGIMSR
jgi:N-acetyl sugar amidotransferase